MICRSRVADCYLGQRVHHIVEVPFGWHIAPGALNRVQGILTFDYTECVVSGFPVPGFLGHFSSSIETT